MFYHCFIIYPVSNSDFWFFQYIPKPSEPAPVLPSQPQNSIYDLDVDPSKSNTSSPSRNLARSAPSVPNQPPMSIPPPLPKRQNAANNGKPIELPKIPARNAPPPLPARRN